MVAAVIMVLMAVVVIMMPAALAIMVFAIMFLSVMAYVLAWIVFPVRMYVAILMVAENTLAVYITFIVSHAFKA